MSEYTKALAELVALQGRLDQQLAQTGKQSAADRRRSEGEIESHLEEHEAVLARLEATLARARAEHVDGGADAARPAPAGVGADPLDQSSQLVTRLEGALDQVLHTRRALAAEEAAMSEEEKRRAAEERRRRERDGLRRDEAWERARQGSNGLLAALAVFTVSGLIAGAVGFGGVLAVPLIAAAVGWGLTMRLESTLPALAVRRAGGAMPQQPSAPPRESRLAGAAYAAVALGLAGLGALLAALATGSEIVVLLLATAFTLAGITVTVCIWVSLPRAK
jgi:hypothetical protein